MTDAPPAPRRRRLRDVLAGRSLDDVELGSGVWRRAHDRFRRAVDRYHQVIEPVEGDARGRLEASGARLAGHLDEVRARCAAAALQWPSDGLQVPGGGADAHHRLSRASTLAAQAAEAATMVRVAARDSAASDAHRDGAPPDVDVIVRRLDAVERAVALVHRELSAPER